ncbi:MAG: short-chain dehydrogenase [Chloroflexi bacterium]|nr:MAG: short-chain dehydrogenase [Chloroflexota bacterium]MBL1194280.1 short-chain dehydrogenase [Chloroflexota bacterium]NOH11570.1 polysaccharide biosynthesis protein [Chloroflexota bacterium]
MDIKGKNALVLGGAGLVGEAVCRQLLEHNPARLVLASLRKFEAEEAYQELKAEFPDSPTKIIPVWGDIFLRAEWQKDNEHPRPGVLADPEKRARLVADIVDEMNYEILEASLLSQFITGKAPVLLDEPAHIVVDCINTATAVAYQNIYASARRMSTLIKDEPATTNWPEEVEMLLSSLYVPQLVRHIQILHEAMVRAGTEAYVKVGTSGTGGMGLNVPYTHGEEKPSRVLMSKAAVAGAQTLLTFLMARTPGKGPHIVKEVKPTALIAWKEVGYGPIRRGGKDFMLYDCTPAQAVSIKDDRNLAPNGKFGSETGEVMEAVYINTGENGLFASGDFAAITALGQMQFVTPEEIAENIVAEIRGGNSGKDVITALDGSVMGPTFRAGYLRQAAINKLQALEKKHGESVAFEILGPPRMSKLLFESFLLKRVYKKMGSALKKSPEDMANALVDEIADHDDLRQQIISIGLPILLPDGEYMLRGPVVKSETAHQGWIDLTPENMTKWQERLTAIREMMSEQLDGDTSSRHDRFHPSLRTWKNDDSFHIGEITAWVSMYEDDGKRGKD